LAGLFEAIFGAEKGWKKNRINRQNLDITGFFRFSPIILRGHSCASLLLANGVPLKQIQEWLGHSDFSITANTYAHLEYNSKLQSAKAMAWIDKTSMGKVPEQATGNVVGNYEATGLQ